MCPDTQQGESVSFLEVLPFKLLFVFGRAGVYVHDKMMLYSCKWLLAWEERSSNGSVICDPFIVWLNPLPQESGSMLRSASAWSSSQSFCGAKDGDFTFHLFASCNFTFNLFASYKEDPVSIHCAVFSCSRHFVALRHSSAHKCCLPCLENSQCLNYQGSTTGGQGLIPHQPIIVALHLTSHASGHFQFIISSFFLVCFEIEAILCSQRAATYCHYLVNHQHDPNQVLNYSHHLPADRMAMRA